MVSPCAYCCSGCKQVISGICDIYCPLADDLLNVTQIRLYSRDMELTAQNILHLEILSSPVIILSLVDNSLLVYTADNTLHHYLIIPTSQSIKLHLCGSISFTGIIAAPNAVRVLSWMIPPSQKRKRLILFKNLK